MKKCFAMLIVLLLLPTFATADVDLSGMSYQELVDLKNQINLAIWESEEWQEVEVPKGIWIVGEDIPAGKWTIKYTEGVNRTVVKWADALDKTGASLSWDGTFFEVEYLYPPNGKYYEKGDPTEVTWDLIEGTYIFVSDGIATFTPYAGKPSLGFK